MWRQVAVVLVVAGVAGLAHLADHEEVAPAQAAPAPANERERFAFDLAATLGNREPSAAILTFLVAWQAAENTTAAHNPIATSQDMPGATPFNSDGVKNYPDYQTGVDATARTLHYAYDGYADIREGIARNDAQHALRGLYASPWGTNADNVARLIEETREGIRAVSLPSGSKALVTPAMEVGAHFDTRDCGAWGFQVGCQHWGTDLPGEEGTPVYAPFDLTVIALGEYGPGPTMGQYVQGVFADGYVFYAGHLEGRHAMQVGETLPAGALLGFTNAYAHTHIQLAGPGNTGACAQDGTCVDFIEYWRTH